MTKRREFFIKRRDTSPALLFQISPPVNLVGATVRFHMRDAAGTVVVDAAGSVPVLPNPTLRYEWTTPDTTTGGSFEAEFEVTYGDGTIETWPNDGYITIRIWEDIA